VKVIEHIFGFEVLGEGRRKRIRLVLSDFAEDVREIREHWSLEEVTKDSPTKTSIDD
jgi:hypothetical protein